MADEMQKEGMKMMEESSPAAKPAKPAASAKSSKPGMTGGMADPKDVEENKLIAAIGYLGVLCFIPLLAKKDSPFAQFHGKQALAVFIVEVVAALVGIIPFVGWVISFVLFVLCLIGAIMGIVNAVGGKQKELPGFSMLAQKLNI